MEKDDLKKYIYKLYEEYLLKNNENRNSENVKNKNPEKNGKLKIQDWFFRCDKQIFL